MIATTLNSELKTQNSTHTTDAFVKTMLSLAEDAPEATVPVRPHNAVIRRLFVKQMRQLTLKGLPPATVEFAGEPFSSVESLASAVENDELNAEDAGFMQGYLNVPSAF